MIYKYQGLRTGNFYGIEYFQGKPMTDIAKRVRNGNKRGTWRYDVNGSSAFTHNNVYYSPETL